MSGVFEALGEAVRRQILALLAGGERSVGEIVAELQAGAPMSQPAVSQHLKVLRESGLVTVRAEGTRRLYTVNAEGLAEAQIWLAGLVDPIAAFEQPLDALATEVARGHKARTTARAREAQRRAGESRRRPA